MAKEKSDHPTTNKGDELARRNWRENRIAPLDTPELRKRIGEVIAEHAGQKQRFTPDPPKKS
jgi:hypothetical protein